jgi:hypothetical protein
MNAAFVVVVVVLVVILVTAAGLLLRSIAASPKRRYGRDLRSIRRIRRGNRAGDPNSTSIGVNSDAFHGS